MKENISLVNFINLHGQSLEKSLRWQYNLSSKKVFSSKGINSTILALILKKDETTRMGDYRPISCCNVLYKVIYLSLRSWQTELKNSPKLHLS